MSERIYFGTIKEVIDAPNLIDLQIRSYAEFLQKDTAPSQRLDVGLEAVMREIFPIESYDGKVVLDYVNYEVGEPKLSALEAIREGESFSAPLHVTYELRDESGSKREKFTWVNFL